MEEDKDDNLNKMLNEHKKIRLQIRPHRKKSAGLAIATIVLALFALALALILITNTSPLSNIVKTYQKDYPDSLLTIQKLTGENAKALKQQIITYCPKFNLDEYYFAQVDNVVTKKSLLFIINTKNGKTECAIDRSVPANTTVNQALGQNILATINEEPIYNEEVLAVYNNIPVASRTNTSLQESLDQVISNKLLMQDAAIKGLVVKEGEIDNAINTFMTNNGLTLQQLEERLASVGSSMNVFRNNTRNNLLLQNEISEITKNALVPTDTDVQKYYDGNKQAFVTKANAKTRQLLIYANESNDAEKLAQIKGIGTMINATNFCELVSLYSQDNVSISRCGQYDFEEGQLLPEYEQVVFSSEPGSTKITKTRLGYHIIDIINVALAQQLSFAQAKNSIANYLLLKNKQDLLSQYIISLRQQAKIVSYIK